MSRPATNHLTAQRSHPGWLDPGALMRIQNLELRARVVVEGLFSGLHRSPFHGFSVEFTEYRQYTTGDDPRYLDWKLYARSDRYYIKRFEDETNLRCQIVVDCSRSMSFESVGYTKADYARTLAATLAYFLHSQRDATGLLTFAEETLEYLPARYRPGHLRRLMLLCDQPASGKSTSLIAPLDRLLTLLHKRSTIVLLSDLLAPLSGLQSQLAALTARGHELIVFQILDPTEMRFEFTDPALFVDAESGREVHIDPQSARQDYLRRFEEHQLQLRRMTDQLGIDYRVLATDQPLEQALLDYLQVRTRRGSARRGRSPSRRGAPR